MTNLNRNVMSFTKGDDILPVTHVTVYYGTDSQGKSLVKEHIAATDNGRTIEKTLAIFTDGTIAQTIADKIYADFQNCPYHSLTASGAELDPALELFDGVTVNSVISVLGSIDTNFNKAMFADISAPGIYEEDEFPYSTTAERTYAINQADTKNSIQTLGTTISATASGITVVQQSLNEHENLQSQYIRYSNGELTLGEENSQFSAKLSPTQLGFYEGSGDPVAYINNQTLNITRALTKTEFQIGNDGTSNCEFITITKRADGHIQFKWTKNA